MGCVIDVSGATSKPQDIVLFEITYAQCFRSTIVRWLHAIRVRGIAVGEVRSGLDRAALVDSIEKIRLVKRHYREQLRIH